MDMSHKLKWIRFIIQIFFKPTLCIIGIFTNLLSCFVVKNKREEKHFKASMYKHIFANSLFNIFFCLLSLTNLLNICIYPKTAFCSNIYTLAFSQYFEIYAVYFLGGSLKFLCNFSNLLLVMSRFRLSTLQSHHLKRLKAIFHKLEFLNLIKVYSIAFVVGLLLNAFKLFEYKIATSLDTFERRFPFNAYEIDFCQDNALYTDIFKFGCKIIPILNLIENLINNILFFCLNTLVDVFLVYHSHVFLRHKKDLHAHEDESHLKMAMNFKENVTKLILINGFLNFLSQSPVLLVSIVLIAFKERMASFCYTYFDCIELTEIAQSFCFLSISFQFFILNKLDRNFRSSLKNLRTRLREFFIWYYFNLCEIRSIRTLINIYLNKNCLFYFLSFILRKGSWNRSWNTDFRIYFDFYEYSRPKSRVNLCKIAPRIVQNCVLKSELQFWSWVLPNVLVILEPSKVRLQTQYWHFMIIMSMHIFLDSYDIILSWLLVKKWSSPFLFIIILCPSSN